MILLGMGVSSEPFSSPEHFGIGRGLRRPSLLVVLIGVCSPLRSGLVSGAAVY